MPHGSHKKSLTTIVPPDCCLHQSFHPLPHDMLFDRAEEVRLLRVMNDSESVSTRVNILVRNNLVTNDVDITLDFGFLEEKSFQLQGDKPISSTDIKGLDIVQVRAFQDHVTEFPRIEVLSALPHPASVIRGPNLVECSHTWLRSDLGSRAQVLHYGRRSPRCSRLTGGGRGSSFAQKRRIGRASLMGMTRSLWRGCLGRACCDSTLWLWRYRCLEPSFPLRANMEAREASLGVRLRRHGRRYI